MFLLFIFFEPWTILWALIITINLLEFSSSSSFLIWGSFAALGWRLSYHLFLMFFLWLFLCASTSPSQWIIFFFFFYLFHHSPVQLFWVRLYIFLTCKYLLGLLKVWLITFFILKGQSPLLRNLVKIFNLDWYSWFLIELLLGILSAVRFNNLIWSILVYRCTKIRIRSMKLRLLS